MVHHFITNIEPYEEEGFDNPVLRCRLRLKEEVKPFLEALKNFVREKVIKSANVQQLEFKGQQMVVAVFEALATEPSLLLPSDTYKKYSEENDLRVLCDYVAGMTDNYLLRTYERLFSPRMGSVFDLL
jgi:dGTPase